VKGRFSDNPRTGFASSRGMRPMVNRFSIISFESRLVKIEWSRVECRPQTTSLLRGRLSISRSEATRSGLGWKVMRLRLLRCSDE